MSELILAVGDENVVFQNLLNDAHSVDKTKHGTKIVFYTDAIQAEELVLGDRKAKKMGLVLWLPRDRVEAAVAAEKKALTDAKAVKLYADHTDNHPTIHCNRFPAWSELTEAQKQEWRERALSSQEGQK